MWCPNCGGDYGEGERCPACGTRGTETPKAEWGGDSDLEAAMKWPRGDDGEPETPVFLAHCSCLNMEDVLMTNLLMAYDIPVIKNYCENGSFGRIVIGVSGSGVDLYVPESRLEEASRLVKGEEL